MIWVCPESLVDLLSRVADRIRTHTAVSSERRRYVRAVKVLTPLRVLDQILYGNCNGQVKHFGGDRICTYRAIGNLLAVERSHDGESHTQKGGTLLFRDVRSFRF